MIPLRVLHVIWSATLGGIEKLVLYLCKEQSQDPELQTGLLIGKAGGSMMPQFEALGIPVSSAEMKYGRDWSPAKLRRTKELMSTYDVIHLHGFNPMLAWAAVSSRRKIIYTEHGNFGFGRKLQFKDLFNRRLQGYFLRHYPDAITYNSNFSRNTAQSIYAIQHIRSEVIYNGIPDNSMIINVENYRCKEDKMLIAAIGRLAGVKRFDRLLNAFSMAKLTSARLILLGEGPEEAELKNMAMHLGISEKVSFPGFGNATELLRQCDLCVLPSKNEAFGLVAVEAYREGKPVLAFSDGGGLTEIVSGIEPQCLFDDEKQMAKALQQFEKTPEMLSNTEANKARIAYSTQFSIGRMNTALKKLYRSI